MKKSQNIFIVLITMLFWSFAINAQHRYKVDYSVEVHFSSAGSTQTFSVHLANFTGDASGPRILNETVNNGPLETAFMNVDRIVPSNQILTGITRNEGTYYDFCNIPDNTSWLFGSRGEVYYFNVYRIEPFSTVNGYSAANSTLSSCLPTTLQIAANSCGSSKYAVQYQVGGSSTWQSYLPYARRNNSFSFDMDDFNGLNNYENLRLRIQHNNDPGNIEYSDVLTYSYIPCSPGLIDTQTSNASCFDSSDGSVELIFDRPLDAGEEFRATLSVVTPEGDTIPLADQGATSFGIGNTYNWPASLVPGDYTLTYQTFFGANPTSTGETGSFTIGRPTEVTVKMENTIQPECVGEFGEVELSADGGQEFQTGSYQYSSNGGAWQASAIFTNLAQGSSNTFRSRLVLGDGTTCESPDTVSANIDQITNGVDINSVSVDQRPSFPGATDGAIEIDITGGLPNFDYQVTGPVTRNLNDRTGRTGTIGNLPAGTYTISVTDDNGCTVTFGSPVILTPIPLPTIAAMEVTSAISCFGATDGQITATITGGEPQYNYEWIRDGISLETGTTDTTFQKSGLEPGTYTLNVASAGGSVSVPAQTTSRSLTLSAPVQLVITSAVANDISCFGGDDGSISVSLSGGTAPYRYRIANTGNFIAATGNTFDIPVTSQGNYPLFIRDANDCQVDFGGNLTISQPVDQIQITELGTSHVDNTENQGSIGVLEIDVINNTGIAQTDWTRNGAPYAPTGASTQTRLVNLPAGNFNVVLTDNNGCTASLDVPIVITEPGPLGITSLSGTNIPCFGDATGSITATVTGTPDFTYIWEKQGDPSFTGDNTNTISGLSAGTYTLRLTDGSTAPAEIAMLTLTEPGSAVTATATPRNVSCNNGNDGTITITASGGTGDYEYALDGGALQSVNTFSGLSAGTYAITVTDGNGCSFDINTTVTQPDAIEVAEVLTNVTNNGGGDGVIAITINGGTAPYDVTWLGPNGFTSNQPDISTLVAGTYTLEIRDVNNTTNSGGCYHVENFTITEPGPLDITNVDTIDVNCKGEATGSISVTAIGTDPTYSWEFEGTPIAGANSNTLVAIVAGIYTVTVDDATANPPVVQAITVGEPDAFLTAEAFITNISCHDADDGSILVTAQGGTGDYEYSMDGGANFQLGNTFTDLNEADYNIVVRDENGCEFVLPNVVRVNNPAPLVLAQIEQTNLTAAGSNDGSISLTAAGGNSPYTYQWSSSDSNFSATTKDIEDLLGGTYSLTVTDANACTVMEEFTITEPGELIVTPEITIFLDCFGDDFGEIVTDVQGGVQPYTYEWFSIEGGNNEPLAEDTETIADLPAGEYFVRVTDANGIITSSNSVLIEQPPLLRIIEENILDILCQGEATGAIDISVQGGTAPYSYLWSNGETTEDLQNVPSGEYMIQVVDGNFCSTEIVVEIEEPRDPMTITNSVLINASAFQVADGEIGIDINGGTGTYSILWTRLSDDTLIAEDQTRISNLLAGSYQVTITDDNGCSLVDVFTIIQPDIINGTIIRPICFNGDDGSITVEVDGGNGNYNFEWNTGATTATISGLTAGTYSVIVTGFQSGPETREYIVENPVEVIADLGSDRTLCNGQTLTLDATIDSPSASYEWSSNNGFSSNEALVELSQAGTYQLTVTDENNCTATDTMILETVSEDVAARFLVGSQGFVGETLLAVDISFPIPDELEWIYPEEATIIKKDNDELEFIFSTAGEYEIGILTTRGGCIEMQFKTILILEDDNTVGNTNGTSSDEEVNVSDFIVYPNPTNGRFTADVTLPERSNISIKVFNFANNALMASMQDRGAEHYSVPFDLSGMPSGVYAVLLETSYGNRLHKLIIL